MANGGSTAREFFLGRPERTQMFSRYSPQNQQVFDELIQSILQQYQTGPSSFLEAFEPIAQKARSDFEQRTVPSIAERFTAFGAGGGRSSAFAQQLGQAGAGLEESLAALGSQFGQRQQQLLQQLMSLGQQSPVLRPSDLGFLGNFARQGLQAAPQYLSMLSGLG